jgi:hypothetical protein
VCVGALVHIKLFEMSVREWKVSRCNNRQYERAATWDAATKPEMEMFARSIIWKVSAHSTKQKESGPTFLVRSSRVQKEKTKKTVAGGEIKSIPNSRSADHPLSPI